MAKLRNLHLIISVCIVVPAALTYGFAPSMVYALRDVTLIHMATAIAGFITPTVHALFLTVQDF